MYTTSSVYISYIGSIIGSLVNIYKVYNCGYFLQFMLRLNT